MLNRRLLRDRALLGAAMSGAVIVLAYLVSVAPAAPGPATPELSRALRLLTVEPWYCDVYDPDGQRLVARSVETFHDGGTLEGRTRLEDREAGTLLLEFSYQGVWQFDDPWLTEAIREYRYLHVDQAAFSDAELAAIEREFAEPEISRVHALTEGQLVYGANQSLYQCHRRSEAVRA
ncbi:MAG: hypothetical protein RIC56_05430 [Pseudomonadales bacterium]